MALLQLAVLLPLTVLVVALRMLVIYSAAGWGLLALFIHGGNLRETGGPRGKGPPATRATFRSCGPPICGARDTSWHLPSETAMGDHARAPHSPHLRDCIPTSCLDWYMVDLEARR